jgi:tetratricopeptide (TPR) repeat protein
LSIRAAIARLEGRQEDIIQLGERAFAVTRRVYGERSLAMARTLGSLGYAYANAGRIVEGNRFRAKAIELLIELKGPDEPNLVQRYEYLGYGLTQEGRTKDALEVLERGLKVAEKVESAVGPRADIMRRLSFALQGIDEPRALALAEESLRLYEKGTDKFEVAKSLYARARALTALGRPSEALKDCQRARLIDSENQDYLGTKRRASAQCEAEALIATNPKAAAQAWERGLQVKPADVSAHIRATFAFGLAQALRISKGDTQRARELASQALHEYALFPAFAERRELIEKWLAAAPE